MGQINEKYKPFIKKAFDKLDKNHDGKITAQDLSGFSFNNK